MAVTRGLPGGPRHQGRPSTSQVAISPRSWAGPLTTPLECEAASQPCPGAAEACGWGVLGRGPCWSRRLHPSPAPAAALWLPSTPGGRGGGSRLTAPTPSIRPAPGLSRGHLSPAPRPPACPPLTRPRPAPPPAHLLPVLRGPGVPQRQGTAPPPCHSPHAVGILHARAEGHEAAAARTNLCLGWGGGWQIQLQGQGFRDLDPDSLEQDREGAQTAAALLPTASPP